MNPLQPRGLGIITGRHYARKPVPHSRDRDHAELSDKRELSVDKGFSMFKSPYSEDQHGTGDTAKRV